MKKELYEKPKIETISLIDIDIITSSAGEGGDVPVESNEINSNNANSNEVDASPWTNNNSVEGNGIFDRFWNIFDEYSSQGETQDSVPTDSNSQETPVEEVPIEENIPEDISNNENNDISE